MIGATTAGTVAAATGNPWAVPLAMVGSTALSTLAQALLAKDDKESKRSIPASGPGQISADLPSGRGYLQPRQSLPQSRESLAASLLRR